MRLRIQKNHMAGRTFKVLEDAFMGVLNKSEDGKQVDEKITKGLYLGERSFDISYNGDQEWGMKVVNEYKQPLRELSQSILGFVGNEASKFGQQGESGSGQAGSSKIASAAKVVSNAAKLWYTVSGQRFDGRSISRKIYTDSNNSVNFNFELYITPHGQDMYTITQNYVSDLYFLHSLLLYGKDEESTELDISAENADKFKSLLDGSSQIFDTAAKYQSKLEPEYGESDGADIAKGNTLDKVSFLFLHCTASKYGSRDIVNAWHLERGFSSIGYNYLFNNGFTNNNVKLSSYKNNENGALHDGRYLSGSSSTLNDSQYAVGAHAQGYNSCSLGLSVVGPYLNSFTPEQLISLRNKIAQLIPLVNGKRLIALSSKEYNKDKSFYDQYLEDIKPYIKRIGCINKKNITYRTISDTNTFLLAMNNTEFEAIQEIIKKYDKRIKTPVTLAGHNTVSQKSCPVYNVGLFAEYVEDNSDVKMYNCIRDKWNLILPEVSGNNVDEEDLVKSCEKKAAKYVERLNSENTPLSIKNFTWPAQSHRTNNPNGTEGAGQTNENYLSSNYKENIKEAPGLFSNLLDSASKALSPLSALNLVLIAPPYINLEVYSSGEKEEELGVLSSQMKYTKQPEENMLFQLRNMLVTNINFEYSNVYYKYQSNPSPNKYGNTSNDPKEHDSFLIPTYIKVNISLESSLKNPFEVYIDQFRLYDLLKDENYTVNDPYVDFMAEEYLRMINLMKHPESVDVNETNTDETNTQE